MIFGNDDNVGGIPDDAVEVEGIDTEETASFGELFEPREISRPGG